MIEWIEERIQWRMDEYGLSQEEADEQAMEDYFDDGSDE